MRLSSPMPCETSSDVGAEPLAEVRDLVDEGDFHRQEHVGGVFDHLRAAARRVDDRAAVAIDRLVDLAHAPRARARPRRR